LGCVCVMSFFLLSGRIFLQSTGRLCCIRDFCGVLLCCIYIWFRLFFATGSCLFEHLSLVGCFVSVVSGIVFMGLCLLSLVSCLFISGSSLVCQSQGYLRSGGQSGCIEGCAASNSGRSLKFELSLAMRGKAVISTEKR